LLTTMSKSPRGGPATPPVSPAPPARRAQAPRKKRRPMPAATDIGHGEDPRVMLGRIVYRQRMQLGISQEDLADQVSLDRTYISGIERGIRNPTFLVLLRLAEVLRVPPSLFMQEDDGKGGASQ
jgi:ribosome-binding protein aMBF1 (putative translation factor)